MIIFAKYGPYERRIFIEECLEKYLSAAGKTRLSDCAHIEKSVNDKPYFKDYPDIRFSISHSGNLVVLAMSETEVGIDIEEIKPRNFEAVVNRHFSEDEKKEAADLEGFLRVWTRKEAYLKLTGEGLGGLADADVSSQITYSGSPLKFTSLDIFKGYAGAVVAAEQPIIFVQLD